MRQKVSQSAGVEQRVVTLTPGMLAGPGYPAAGERGISEDRNPIR